jgi:hypothetical protein
MVITKVDNVGVMTAVSCMSDEWDPIKQKVCVAMLLCNRELAKKRRIRDAMDALNECHQAFKVKASENAMEYGNRPQAEQNLISMIQAEIGDRLLALHALIPEWTLPCESTVFRV